MDSYTPEVTNLLYDELLNSTSRAAANRTIYGQRTIYLGLLDELSAITYVDPTEVESIIKIINSGKLKDVHEPLKGIMNRTFANNEQAYLFAVDKITRHYKTAGIGGSLLDSKGYAQEEIQEIFKNAGYDSITHLGGRRTGQEELHRVYIVFSDFYERHGKPRGNLTQKDLDAMTPSEIDQLWADSDWANYNEHTGAIIPDDVSASYFDRIVNWPNVETSPLDRIPAGGYIHPSISGQASDFYGPALPGDAVYSEETNVENLIKAIEDKYAPQRRN